MTTNNNKKKPSAARKLIPAIGMLTVSAMMLSSSTYAWFTMNKTVEATNMQVRATAEEGLLINEVATAGDTNWDDEATAAQTASNVCLLYPASTANGANWYHAASKKANSAASAASGAASSDLSGAYAELTSLTAITGMSTAATAGTTAKRDTMGTSATASAGYYVHYTYYLKGSTGSATTLATTAGSKNVYIKSVTATAPVTAASADLNKSLRVGIFMKASGTFYIYAPVTGYTATYYVNAGSTATEPIASNTATATDLTSLPAASDPGTPVEVYLWYEGEDAACMSANATATTLDNLDVDIVFELKDVPTT